MYTTSRVSAILSGYFNREHATTAAKAAAPTPGDARAHCRFVGDICAAATQMDEKAYVTTQAEDPGFVEADPAKWSLVVSEPFGAALCDWVRANQQAPDDEQMRMVLDWVLVQAGYSPRSAS